MPDVGAVAHKAGGKLGDYAPLLIAVLLIGGAIYVYSHASGSSGYQVIPGTNNSAERTAADAANATAQQAHQAGIMQGFSALVGEATTQYNDDTQVTLGLQTLAGQVEQYKTQQTIAQYAEQASIAQSNAALSAAQAQAHAQQQNGLWSSISSIFSSGLSAFTGGLFGGGKSSGYTGPAPNAGSFGTWG